MQRRDLAQDENLNKNDYEKADAILNNVSHSLINFRLSSCISSSKIFLTTNAC
jgi:hypothetical protein